MRVVHISWIDSQTDQGWNDTDPKEYEKEHLTHSVGFFLFETHSFVVIAHSFDPHTKECNGRIAIPLVAVKDIRTLCQIKT